MLCVSICVLFIQCLVCYQHLGNHFFLNLLFGETRDGVWFRRGSMPRTCTLSVRGHRRCYQVTRRGEPSSFWFLRIPILHRALPVVWRSLQAPICALHVSFSWRYPDPRVGNGDMLEPVQSPYSLRYPLLLMSRDWGLSICHWVLKSATNDTRMNF